MAGTHNQQVLAEHKAKFERRVTGGREFNKLLREIDAEPNRFVEDPRDGRRWWIYITLPRHVRETFDLHLEVLCLSASYERVEPRTLNTIAERLLEREARLDPDFAILLTPDPAAADLVRRRRGQLAILTVNSDELISGPPVGLRERIAEIMITHDHYDLTLPVTEPAAFYGRRAEVATLDFALDRGQPVGIFGLRKAGKTSLLNFVEQHRTRLGKHAVRVDISGQTAEQFQLALLEKCHGIVRKHGRPVPRLMTLTRSGDPNPAVPVSTYWIRDLHALLDVLPGRLELFIDEIDQAWPGRSHVGAEEATAVFNSLIQLRGVIQSREAEGKEGIGIICAGVDPAIFERPLLDGRDNLLYKFARLVFLSPMSRDEMQEMVRSLGKRMGLRYRDADTIDFLFREFGGHPLLTRKACSAAARKRPGQEIPWHVPLAALEEAARIQGPNSPRSEVGDVLESFTEWFGDEAAMLPLLWSEDPDERTEAREWARSEPDMAAHLVSYGITDDDWAPRIHAMRALVLR
ncbi:hypothetical protein [Streptomyces roseolilacinus]|uniref:Uncharacterized protein n=1 Tax=Streptomyces roseolilacinus TaxID=66904 RepID=A0A918B4R4_9ACTN|nr:hypothetical protein [Streptomyces roseolilacinus]GGQ13295.1 hypothetical protein GCM10010249_35080 [Streptomyces roseolilacinus]